MIVILSLSTCARDADQTKTHITQIYVELLCWHQPCPLAGRSYSARFSGIAVASRFVIALVLAHFACGVLVASELVPMGGCRIIIAVLAVVVVSSWVLRGAASQRERMLAEC